MSDEDEEEKSSQAGSTKQDTRMSLSEADAFDK